MRLYCFLCCFLNIFHSASQLELHLAMQIVPGWASESDSKEKKYQLVYLSFAPSSLVCPSPLLSTWVSDIPPSSSHTSSKQETVCTVTGLEIQMQVVQPKWYSCVAGDCKDAHCAACQTLQNSALLSPPDTTNLSLSSQARWQLSWNS